MAATRLIALHVNKGRTVAQCLADRTDYVKNPEKTDKGNLVTSYQCDPYTVDEEFMLSKRTYFQTTGKTQKNDVIAYQIRQSFKPGEITPEEANRLGNELAMRFTKGKFAFIVATHTDRKHIHNHIVFNSTSLEGDRKFRNFWFSGLALQRISDLVCLENGLSIIESKPYGERERDVKFQKQEKIRDHICNDIDQLLQNRPGNFEDFLFQLQRSGYEIKRGKHIALRGKNQKRFVRLTSLPDGYKEEDLRTYFTEIKEGNFRERSKGRYECSKKSSFNLIIDIQKKMQDKGPGYKRWATVYNLKQMSKTLLFLRDHDLQSVEQLDEMISKNIEKRDQLLASIQEKEKQLKKITALKTHIINYSKTRIVYEAYRKSGYSKKYLEEHFEEVAIHKAAKVAFDEYEVRRIPSVKELNAQYLEILDVKKKEYVEYRKIKTEIPEYLIAKKNIASLYDAEKRYEANINDRKLER